MISVLDGRARFYSCNVSRIQRLHGDPGGDSGSAIVRFLDDQGSTSIATRWLEALNLQ